MIFDCSGCQRPLQVQPEWTGRSVRCPHCRQVVSVPATPKTRQEKYGPAAANSKSASAEETLSRETLPPEEIDPSCELPAGSPAGNSSTSTAQERVDFRSFLHPPQSADELGRLAGYRITKLLGEGGMGLVFHAEELALGREVALKVIRPELVDQHAKERFLREAQAAAVIDNERVITIYQVGEDNGIPFVAMRLLKGESLKDRLAKGATLEVREIVRIGQEIAEGLAAAHAKGLIHRDIKPSNIWLEGTQSNVKLLDFGLVKRGGSETNLTRTGTILGTPAYMAPEQAANRNVDVRSDLFSLGCVLYQCCTRRLPFHGDDLLALLSAMANQPHVPIATLNPKVPKSLIALIDRLLAKQPEQRPEMAQNVTDALAKIRLELENDTARVLPDSLLSNELVGAEVNPSQDDTQSMATSGRALPVAIPLSGRKKSPLKWRMWLIPAAVLLLAVLVGCVFYGMNGDPGKKKKDTTVAKVNGSKSNNNSPEGNANSKKNPDDPVLPTLNPPRPSAKDDEEKLLYPAARCASFQGIIESADRVYPFPDGKRIVGSTRNQTVKIWDSQTGKELNEFREHAGGIIDLSFSSDGKLIASAGNDQTIRVWNSETGIVQMLKRPANGVRKVAVSPDGKRIISVGSNKANSVEVWDAQTGKKLLELKGHTNGINDVACSPDGRWILAANSETVKIWNAQTGKEVRTLNPTEPIRGVTLSPDGKRVALVGNSWNHNGKVSVWDTATGKKSYSLVTSRSQRAYCQAFSPDGKRIVSVGDQVQMWDAQTGRLLHQQTMSFSSYVRSAAFTSDSKRIILGTTDKGIQVWTPLTADEVLTTAEQEYAIQQVVFSPDGKRVAGSIKGATGRRSAVVKEWDADFGKEIRTLMPRGENGDLFGAIYNPDGTRIATICKDTTIKIWNPKTEQVLKRLKGHTDAVSSIAYSPDGQRIISGSADKTVRIWDVQTEEALRTIKLEASKVLSVAVSPNGKFVASANADKTVKVWDTQSGNLVAAFNTTNTVGPDNLAFSPVDSNRLAYREGDLIVVLDVETAKEVLNLKGSRFTTSFSYSPDGKRIAAGGSNFIDLWDSQTGKQLYSLWGPVGSVRSVSFSPNGQRLASGGMDNRVRIWELEVR